MTVRRKALQSEGTCFFITLTKDGLQLLYKKSFIVNLTLAGRESILTNSKLFVLIGAKLHWF